VYHRPADVNPFEPYGPRMTPSLFRRARALLVLAASLAVLHAAADAYPSRPVRVVVPYAPGGGTDVVARVLAQKMSADLKQQFIVENRGGAGGTIGTEVVAKAAPDGYTLMLVPTSHVINPSIY